MRRRTRPPIPPLPQRRGVDPVRVRLPGTGTWATVRDHLVDRLGAAVPPERVDAMFAAGEVHGSDGPLAPDAAFRPGGHVWFHRELPEEVPVPFGIEVLHRDERLLVVDKPHFLATMPRGGHVVETALSRLRHDLALPELSPAHRLDRLTAGVVMFVIRPELRGAYQTIFRDRLVRKEYEAVARHDPALALPRTVESRIVKERGEMAAREVPGEPNARSHVDLLEHRDGLARYRLRPETGRTHQLRVHMNGLGVPILGDPVYPHVLPPAAPGDFTRPLRLLARVLEFDDPVTGDRHRFESRRTLFTRRPPGPGAPDGAPG
ncbi:pseudouridine synthase [Actinacidiphila glaucinigra]|uniref:pseudouridine synthase n=1 Tax=Actinacidiphila glaucinigra TaxID=235986 RepID=UPI0036A69914